MQQIVFDIVVFGVPLVIGGLLMGKYYGKPPKDDKDQGDKKDK